MRRELFPFEPRYFQQGAHKQHYVDEGKGAPVLMVHGNPSWSFYYRELISALSTTHRAIAVDHIGCGRSDKPSDASYEYSLRQRVEDLGRFVDHLRLDRKLTLVVHDWGGMIGMAWAVEHPERVERLVVLNTAAFHLPATKRMPWQLSLARDSKLGALLVRGFNAFSFGATYLAVKRPLPAEIRAAYREPYDSWDNRVATLRFVQDIPLVPSDRGYDLITKTAAKLSVFDRTPTLIGWGLQDFVFDHHFLSEWKRRLPNATVHEYPSAGHYVLEDAKDELIPLITRFVSS